MTERRVLNAQPWNESLFGCCTDQATCCYGCFCTPCLFGENQSKTNKDEGGNTACCGYCILWWGLCCIVHRPARVRFREAYGLLPGSVCNDCCATWCCSPCGVCQEAREIKSRGNAPMVTLVGHAQPVTVAPATGVLIT